MRQELNLCVMFGVIVMITIAGVANAHDIKFGERPDGLVLEISIEERDVFPLEPIRFAVSLTNTTDSKFTHVPSLHPRLDDFRILVSKDGKDYGEFQSTDGYLPSLATLGEDRVLFPGKKISHEGYLYVSEVPTSEGKTEVSYLFPEPGTYNIKGVLKSFDKTYEMTSNVLTKRVKEPPASEKEAYEFIRSASEMHSGFLLGIHHYFLESRITLRHASIGKNDPLKAQMEFLERFPDSYYARYLFYSRGMVYKNRFLYSAENLNEALEYLEKAGYSEGFLFGDQALASAAKIRFKINDLDKAAEYIETLDERYPDSVFTREAKSGYQRMLRIESDPSYLMKQNQKFFDVLLVLVTDPGNSGSKRSLWAVENLLQSFSDRVSVEEVEGFLDKIAPHVGEDQKQIDKIAELRKLAHERLKPAEVPAPDPDAETPSSE